MFKENTTSFYFLFGNFSKTNQIFSFQIVYFCYIFYLFIHLRLNHALLFMWYSQMYLCYLFYKYAYILSVFVTITIIACPGSFSIWRFSDAKLVWWYLKVSNLFPWTGINKSYQSQSCLCCKIICFIPPNIVTYFQCTILQYHIA